MHFHHRLPHEEQPTLRPIYKIRKWSITPKVSVLLAEAKQSPYFWGLSDWLLLYIGFFRALKKNLVVKISSTIYCLKSFDCETFWPEFFPTFFFFLNFKKRPVKYFVLAYDLSIEVRPCLFLEFFLEKFSKIFFF